MWLSYLLRKFATKVIARPIRRQLAAFEAATCQPQEMQEALLRRILAHHADTISDGTITSTIFAPSQIIAGTWTSPATNTSSRTSTASAGAT